MPYFWTHLEVAMPSSPVQVPRIIHAFWGGPEMPAYLRDFWTRWTDLHPSYEMYLWTPESLPRLRMQRIYDDPEKYSPKSNPWQWRSDIVRYELLHDFGGVWVDMDLEPLRPVDDLLSQRFAAWEDRQFVGTSFLGSEPESLWMAELLEDLPGWIEAHPDLRCNKQTGPYYLTDHTKPRHGVNVLPRELVFAYRWDELHRVSEAPSPDAYTVHHWHNKRTLTDTPLSTADLEERA